MGGLTEMFKKPQLPKVPDPTRVPDAMDPSVVEEGRRRKQMQRTASGRDSTNLEGAKPAYSSTDLGL